MPQSAISGDRAQCRLPVREIAHLLMTLTSALPVHR